jgi:hypothetical protein
MNAMRTTTGYLHRKSTALWIAKTAHDEAATAQTIR